ncbi:MAG: YjbQ family protein [Chloroflexi bacterium]|nr:MAG: YjbQ family protein [Chloroflexota bacterium]
MSWVTLEVKTTRRAQLVDITERLAEAVTGSGVDDGVCHVYVPHTTAGVTINEGARLEHLVTKEADYEHAEGNSDSHIKTALVGPSCAAPVRGGKLALGTWQAIFLCEWDGPRTRRVEVGVSAL